MKKQSCINNSPVFTKISKHLFLTIQVSYNPLLPGPRK